MKTILGCLAVATLLVASTAHAAFIDGYQDRRGFLLGLNAAGGGGHTSIDGGSDLDTVGFMGALRLGGGVSRELTLDFEPSVWFGSDEAGGVNVEQRHLGFLVNANYFIHDGLFVRGGLGFASVTIDPEGGSSDSESGFGLGAALGYDFFANSDLAFQVSGFFRQYFYDQIDFSLFGLSIGLTWY